MIFSSTSQPWRLSHQFLTTYRRFQTSRAVTAINCNMASICKTHRQVYARTYPTVVVLPNGSSINIGYHEPRKIIKLPLDMSTLNEQQQKARLERRKPKIKIKITEEIDDDFDPNKYVNFVKK